MATFYRDVLRLSLDHKYGEFAVFRLPDDSKTETFGLSDTELTYWPKGPVVGFFVGVEAARKSLNAEGTEFIDPPQMELTGGMVALSRLGRQRARDYSGIGEPMIR
jgi:predicted enzyme related to lactoylglutathione lyase